MRRRPIRRAFPEQLEEGLHVWQPQKFYFSEGRPFGFGRASPTPSPGVTQVDLGGYDPLLGRTYAEIGSHARSMHKCQGMSPLIMLPGPAVARYRLAETRIPGQVDTIETSLFDGVDTSIEGLARFADLTGPNALVDGLSTVARHAGAALLAFESVGMDGAVEPVLLGLTAVRSLRDQLGGFGLSDAAPVGD